MIGIRCHNPDSLFLDCRLRSTTMPVRASSSETLFDSVFHAIRTSHRHPDLAVSNLNRNWNARCAGRRLRGGCGSRGRREVGR